MNLFDILSYGERVIVHVDPTENAIVTWNHSATFQLWQCDDSGDFGDCERSIMTYGGTKPLTYETARMKAAAWYASSPADDR